MRNRSIKELPIVFCAFDLPAAFPCELLGASQQADKPISYLHAHDCLELGYCHEGAGVFMVGRKLLPYKTGDVSVINHKEAHLARSAEGTTSVWSWILVDPPRMVGPTAPEVELLDPSMLCGESFKNIIEPSDDARLAPLVHLIVQELERGGAGHRLAVRGLVMSVMARLRRLSAPITTPPAETSDTTSNDALSRVAPAVKAMIEGYHKKLGMPDLASRCGMSVACFRRIFHEAAGTSPCEYLSRIRTRMAATLLESTMRQVGEIALDVGYPTISSLNRNFLDAYGMSPRAWRKKKRHVRVKSGVSARRAPGSAGFQPASLPGETPAVPGGMPHWRAVLPR